MRTLIINGSPKGKKGNTEIFIQRFVKEMKNPYEICYAARVGRLEIDKYVKEFDTVILAMPLYVHAMPGIVMKMIECMEPTSDDGKAMGFIVQSGFMESSQSKYLERYLSALTRNLNYNYLGTVIRGGAAGTSMMPDQMNKKLFKQLGMLGQYFDKNGSFNIEIVKELAKPNRLSSCKSRMLQFLGRLGLGDTMFWNMMLKENNAFDKRFDKPFVAGLSE